MNVSRTRTLSIPYLLSKQFVIFDITGVILCLLSMKTIHRFAPVCLLLFSACSEPEPKSIRDDCLTISSKSNGHPVVDRYIISLPSDEESSEGRQKMIRTTEVLQRQGVDSNRIINQFRGTYSHVVVRLTSSEAARFARDSSVHIEQDKIVSMCACFSVIEPKLITWNIEKTGYGDGEGKTAWLLDTGIDLKHPDLNVDTVRSRTFIPGEESAQDENGHGTHVAGIIGALNNRIGTLGVASGTKLVGLKVLDGEGNGYLSYVLDAVSYVHQNAKTGEVINISLAVEEMSDILDQEILKLAEKGIYVVIAAGNESAPASNYSPGRTNGTNIYTVSAVDSLDHFAAFSNYGNDAIDYAAPGVRVLSTYLGGKYAIMSGTSMAAPHVSGLLLVNEGKINSTAHALSDPDGVADPVARK